MADVFISYKSRMRPRVRELAEAFESLGLTVWFDAELEAGRSFAAVINGELEKARCIVVCWTPDAFAPVDGSEVSWVEAEATVARERKVIVPIMLERVALRAPWNMFHTERMMDWPAGAHDYPAWQSLLDAVGRNVERPGLAEYALALGNPPALAAWAAKYPDDPLAAAAVDPSTVTPVDQAKTLFRRATRMNRATQWLVGASVFNVLAAIFVLLRFAPDSTGNSSYIVNLGPLVAAAVWAVALWRSGTLDIGRALFTIMATAIGYVVAIFTAPLVEPTMLLFNTGADQARGFINGIYSGFGGSFVALAGIALLIGNVGRNHWIEILVGSLVLGLACGILGLGPLKPLYESNFFWISICWLIGYGVMLTRLALANRR